MGFYRVQPAFDGFGRVSVRFEPDSNPILWVLLGFTEFYWVLPSCTGFYGFYWVLLGFIGFCLVVLVFMGFTGFYWVLQCFADFY